MRARVRWLPDPSHPIRGRSYPEKQVIEIYDSGEEAARALGMHTQALIMPFWNKMESVFIERSMRENRPYATVYLEFLKDEVLKRRVYPRGKAAYLGKD